MQFSFAHNNFNVRDLEKSIAFYNEALGLTEVLRKVAEDGSYILVFLGDAAGNTHQLELTWLRDWDRPYNLGDNEFHLAFKVDDGHLGIRDALCFNPDVQKPFRNETEHPFVVGGIAGCVDSLFQLGQDTKKPAAILLKDWTLHDEHVEAVSGG